MATAFPSLAELDKARTDAAQFSGGQAYGLTFTVGGQQFSFVPNNVAQNGGVTSGANTYLLPYFTNIDNLKNFGSNAQSVDLSSIGLTKYLESQGLTDKGYLLPTGAVPFDSQVNAVPTSVFGGDLNGLRVIDGQVAYGLSGGAGKRYATTTGEVHDPKITKGGGLLGELGQAVLDLGPIAPLLGNLVMPGLGTAIAVGTTIGKGGSVEDLAKGYIAAEVGSEIGADVGGVTGQIAGGTAAGLLSGQTPEDALKGSLVSTGVSQVTPSNLLTSTPSGETGTQEYIPELNIGQGTPSSTSSFYAPTVDVAPKNIVQPTTITPQIPSGNLINETGQITDFAKNTETGDLYKPLGTNEYGGNYVPVLGSQGQAQGMLTGQGTTGATNMADYYTNDYENYQSNPVYDYGSVPTDITGGEGFYDTGSAPMTQEQIDASMQTYGGSSSLDATTQALIKRALATGGSAATAAKNFLSSMVGGMNSNLLQGGAGTAAQLMQLQANKQAAQQAQARIGQATQQAVAGAQFRPVGTTTRFGTSQFQVDPATGQLVSAGYTAAPEITSAQNRLLGLGASYLAQTPEEVAQQYMNKQYDLLDPSRQRQLAGIRNQNFQTGRGGLSVGSTGLRPSGAQGLMGANPELEAYYNAMAQQDAQLAAQAQQAGQQNVLFGTGLFGQAGQLETMAQQPFTLSQSLAEKSALGGARSGQLGIQGNVYGNAIGLSAANTTNPYATVLGGLSSPTSLLAQGLGSYFGSSAPSNVGGTGSVFNTGYYDPMQQQF